MWYYAILPPPPTHTHHPHTHTLPTHAHSRTHTTPTHTGVQLKIRPASNSIHSIPENRELLEGRRVSLGGVATNSWNFDLGMATEIHDVLSGLNAFKTELLQLHAVVSVRSAVCGWVLCVYEWVE